MNSIFVSSTFRDMQYERDAIRDISTPIINKIANKYGEKVSFCDLRWGINTENLDDEISERKVLSVCLDEIDRCNPPMVVILGYRYGYIPSSNLISDIAKRKELQLEDYKKSVTALEIEYGALLSKSKISNTLFYFREIEGILPKEYIDADEEYSKKLKELKEKIIALSNGRLKTYKLSISNGTVSGIKEFATIVANDIINHLEPKWKSKKKLTPVERECMIHWNYAKEKNALFRARTSLSKHYIDKIQNGQQIILIKGTTGCGKSTLLANLAVELKKTKNNVIPFFCGLTSQTSISTSILKNIVWILENVANEEHLHIKLKREYGIKYEDIQLTDWYKQFNACCTLLSNRKKEFYFIIDAIDQLIDEEPLNNLIPFDIPKGFHFIFSCVSDYNTEEIETETLSLLNKNEIQDVINGVLESHHRELSHTVIAAIVNKKNSCNPLYVNLLIERLLLMNANDYNIISNAGDGINSIANHQLTIIHNSSNNLNDLCYSILVEGGNRINALLIPEVLKYIAITKHGTTKETLKSILKDKWSELDFAYFVSYMNDFFILREDGRYDFFHKNIRAAILSFTDRLIDRHKDIFDYALNHSDTPLYDEIIYHAVNSQQAEYVVNKVSSDNASLVEDYIFNGLNPSFIIDITKCAINSDNKTAVYFVVDNLLTRCIRENKTEIAYQIIKYCKSFFNENNPLINCLEYLRFAIEEMYFYILNDDLTNMASMNKLLINLVSDATKVNVKEDEIEEENIKRQIYSEKSKKRLDELHKEGKYKWLVMPTSILDFVGSFYSEERCIKRFKNQLIEIANMLLDTVKKHYSCTKDNFHSAVSKLEFPTYIDFGMYKGWLLDTGESRWSFRLRMQALASQIPDRKIIIYADTNDE